MVISKGLSCYLTLRKARKESVALLKDDFPKPVSLKSTCPTCPLFAFPLPRLAQQWQIYAITRICSVIRGPAWQRPGFDGYLSCFFKFWSCLCVCFLSSSSSKAVQKRPLRGKQTGTVWLSQTGSCPAKIGGLQSAHCYLASQLPSAFASEGGRRERVSETVRRV